MSQIQLDAAKRVAALSPRTINADLMQVESSHQKTLITNNETTGRMAVDHSSGKAAQNL